MVASDDTMTTTMTQGIVREIIGSAVASLFDPSPIRFKLADERGVLPVRRACGASGVECVSLRTPLNRNAFLCGCLDLTDGDSVEHLIVGFGKRQSSTTKVVEVGHVHGTETRVDIPEWLRSRIERWLGREHRTEVLVFHNHPPNALNVVFDNSPLPSGTDRSTLLAYYLRPSVALKAAFEGGRVRFYLGENGFVREFHTPDLVTLLRSQKLGRFRGPR